MPRQPMTDRKFYKTVISVEVLSEEPIPEDMELEDVLKESIEGSYSGRTLGQKVLTINGRQAANALKRQGSDPGFFRLTNSGANNEH